MNHWKALSADREGAVSRRIREPEDPVGSEPRLGFVTILGARTPDPIMQRPALGGRNPGLRRSLLTRLWVGAFLPALALGQPPTVARGFAAQAFHREASSPFAISALVAGAAGSDHLFAAMRNEIRELDGRGSATPIFRLAPGDSFGVFVHDPRARRLVFTSFTTGALYAYDLRTGTATSCAAPTNAFSAALLPGGAVLVSANPTWPAPGAATGVWLVDPTGLAHRELIRLSGPSGPLALAGNGDLYVAVLPATVPPPTGSVRLLRFAAHRVLAALGGGPKLFESDAAATLPGLDGAYDLTLDDRGRVLWSDPNLGVVRGTLPGTFALDPTPLFATTGGALRLAFVRGIRGTFAPYQDESSGHLVVLTSDWSTACTAWIVAPVRPWIATSPGGSASAGLVRVHVFGAEPNALLGIAVSFVAPGPEDVRGLLDGVPLWWSLPATPAPGWFLTSTAADGHAQLDLYHPGGFATSAWFAAAFVSGTVPQRRSGTTAVTSLNLLP